MLLQRLQEPDKISSPFNFDDDFYERPNYWLRFGIVLKFLTFLYVILYGPYRLILAIQKIIVPLLKNFNTAI
jgi:hypothetical protein